VAELSSVPANRNKSPLRASTLDLKETKTLLKELASKGVRVSPSKMRDY